MTDPDDDNDLDRSERAMAEVPGAALSDEEADEMFEAAWQTSGRAEEGNQEPAEVERLEPASDERSNRFGTRAVAAAAAVLLVAAGAFWWLNSPSRPPTDRTETGGIKSPGSTPEVELLPFGGRLESGSPRVGNRLRDGETLESGEHVLFRYRLSRRARLVLLGQPQGGEVEGLWRSERRVPGREAEIQADGRALALDPGRYDGSFRLALVAVADDTGLAERLSSIEMLSESAIRGACESCGYDLVQLRAP